MVFMPSNGTVVRVMFCMWVLGRVVFTQRFLVRVFGGVKERGLTCCHGVLVWKVSFIVGVMSAVIFWF